jgi:hypothetical protein
MAAAIPEAMALMRGSMWMADELEEAAVMGNSDQGPRACPAAQPLQTNLPGSAV